MAIRISVIVCSTSFLLGMSLLVNSDFAVACMWLTVTSGPFSSFLLWNHDDPHDCATTFFIGLLFTHWIADSLTLWKGPITDEHLASAALYYNIITKGLTIIPWFPYLALFVTILGGGAILWSLGDGAAGNLMFDGGSACASHMLVFRVRYINAHHLLFSVVQSYTAPL